MNQNRVDICRQLLFRYNREKEDFLNIIVTGDESWVHHYDPENKRQSMEFRHKTSPCPKKFKVQALAGKVILTVFWDSKGVVHTDYLEKGTTINSVRYIETLKRLKKRIKRVRPNYTQLLLQHDNARPHCSHAKWKPLIHQSFHIYPTVRIRHSVIFFLFPKLKDISKV